MPPMKSTTEVRVPTLTLNGQDEPLDGAVSVGDLLDRKSLRERRIAIERNGEIVPRSAVDRTVLQDGDRIEIVVAVGGG
jgi:sulfur carrier protein